MRPLVGHDRIVLYGSALVTYSRERDDATYLAETEVPHAGIGPIENVHAVQLAEDTDLRYDVVFYEGGNETDRVSISGVRPAGMTVGREEAYVGTSSREILAIESGEVDWRVAGTNPALADGRLYAAETSDGGAVAYDERSGIDGMLSAGPEPRWTGEWLEGEVNATAVADGRLVVGTYAAPPNSGVVGAYDVETGERLWEPRSLGHAVATPAVVGDRGYAAVGTGGLEAGRVVALDLSTGDTLWEDETDWYAHSPAVGGETLVVLGDVRRSDVPGDGVVRAYDAASGEELWTVTFDRLGPNVGGVALADDRVYVTVGTTVYELE